MNEENLMDSTETLFKLAPIFEKQTPAVPMVEVFDDKLKELANALLDFAKKCDSPKLAGLAANQLSLNGERLMANVCVVMQNSISKSGEMQDSGNWIVAVNPYIYKHTDNKEMGREGCLTWPGKAIEAERHLSVSVRYQDLDGKEIYHGAMDFVAAVWQHEINHLMGVKEVVVHPKTGRLYGVSYDDGGGGPVIIGKKTGRNELCPCCSGNKYKKCCGQ